MTPPAVKPENTGDEVPITSPLPGEVRVPAGSATLSPRWSLIIVLSLLSGFGPFSTDMYLSGLGLIAEDLKATNAEAALTLSAFFAGMALGPLVYGPLSDRLGRRGPLLLGMVLFTVTSGAILVTYNIHWMIGLRFFQAIGGAASMIISRALLADFLDEREIARYLSWMMTIALFAPLVAPSVGAWLINHFHWRSTFVFMTVFGVVCVLATWRYVPETLAPEKRKRSGGIKQLKAYLHLSAKREFLSPLLIGAFGQASMFCFITGSPLVMMEIYGVSNERYGLIFALVALGFCLSAQINRWLLKSYSPERIMKWGLVANVTVAVVLLMMTPFMSLIVLIALLLACTFTMGLVGPNISAVAMAHARENAGCGSALLGFSQFGIGTLVSMLVGFLYNGTAWAMTGMIAVCSFLSMIVYVADRFLAPGPKVGKARA